MPTIKKNWRPHRRRRCARPQRGDPRGRQGGPQFAGRGHRPRGQLRRPDLPGEVAHPDAARRAPAFCASAAPSSAPSTAATRLPSRSSRPTARSTTAIAWSRCSRGWSSMRSSASAATARWRSRTSSTRRAFRSSACPKTIDNDIVGTTSCFGFDTAVSFATDAIDRLHTTAEAHRRIMVRRGDGPLRRLDRPAQRRGRRRRRHPDSRDPVRPDEGRRLHPRSRCLGRPLQHRRRGRRRARRRTGRPRWSRKRTTGTSSVSAGKACGCAKQLGELTGKETRHVVLGHLQRGGSADGVRSHAGDAVRRQGRRADPEGAVRKDGREPSARPRAGAAGRGRRQDRRPCRSTTTSATARAMGVSFGD